jgi:apolipoprotein N-acyltransferase
MECKRKAHSAGTQQVAGPHIAALATAEKRTIPLAALSAVCLATPLFYPLAFPIAWIGLVPLLIALQTQRWQIAFAASVLFGFVFHGLANYWLVPTISNLAPFAQSTKQAMAIWAVVGFFALLLWQSLFSVLFGMLVWWVGQRCGNKWLVPAIGSSWLLTEWLRSLGTFGYPWALLASTQVAFLPIVQLAAWVGSFGLSGIIALINAFLFQWWWERKSIFLLLAFAILTLSCLFGWLEIRRVEKQVNLSPHLKVAVVQGNFGMERWRPDVTFEELREILKTHLSLSEQAARQGAKLIVWSETALPWRLRDNGVWSYGASELFEFVKQHKVVLFVGAGEWREGKSYNACFVFAPEGKLSGEEVAHKIRLVPFGEYLPGREWFPWLEKILPHAPVETAPGQRRTETVLRVGNKVVKPAIVVCFESLFPFHIRHLVGNLFTSTHIANLIVIITNDSWFGNTLAPYHHARIAVLRAVEMRRAVVRGAGTGISLVVAPTGKVVQASKWDDRCVLTASVPLMEKSSGYQIWGDLPFVVLALATLVVAWRKR